MTTGKTNSYKEPILYQLPTLVDSQGIYSIPNVNIGLIRPGKVQLFKYIAGSVEDKDGDDKLSDEEKATGKPLAGAEFDLYDESTDTKISSATMDENGLVGFDDLFAGKYCLVETKAPTGYELVKSRIPFEIVFGNQTIELFQDNYVATVLPFAGSNRLLILIVVAVSTTLVGLVIIGIKYMKK